MTDNEKIHPILEYICTNYKHGIVDTDEIADELDMALSEVNILARSIIQEGGAKDGGSNDSTTLEKGAVSILQTVATCDAYETEKYLKSQNHSQTYNLFITTQTSTYNILDISKEQLFRVIEAYLNGEETFALSGEKYWLSKLFSLKIFTYEQKVDFDEFREQCKQKGHWKHSMNDSYFTAEGLNLMGNEITDKMIGNAEYGESKGTNQTENNLEFVDNSRLDELRALDQSNFDLTKLIRLCEELNDNFIRGNYLSVGMIGRTILNHVPPIFGFTKFSQVANNYGGRSFKKNMQHLNTSLRSIADSYLHEKITAKETLPNATQVGYQQDLDRLLEEIVRILK